MTEHPDPADVPTYPAATVMLIRDVEAGDGAGDGAEGDGIEVFMLRRTSSASFGAGMCVFPGGRVDAADATDEAAACCVGIDDATASAALDIPAHGLAFWIAAVRESFEEAGVLLARTSDGQAPAVDAADRIRIHDAELSLVELCERDDLVIDLSGVHYVDHWITPLGERRRFDTRFFIARVPDGQELLHDDVETVESLWIRPGHALALFDAGEMTLMPPTIINLRRLATFSSVDAALDAALAMDRPTPIQPHVRLDENGRFNGVSLPWDDDYESLGGTPTAPTWANADLFT